MRIAALLALTMLAHSPAAHSQSTSPVQDKDKSLAIGFMTADDSSKFDFLDCGISFWPKEFSKEAEGDDFKHYIFLRDQDHGQILLRGRLVIVNLKTPPRFFVKAGYSRLENERHSLIIEETYELEKDAGHEYGDVKGTIKITHDDVTQTFDVEGEYGC
jgi:hypothetical protein